MYYQAVPSNQYQNQLLKKGLSELWFLKDVQALCIMGLHVRF